MLNYKGKSQIQALLRDTSFLLFRVKISCSWFGFNYLMLESAIAGLAYVQKVLPCVPHITAVSFGV